MLQAWQTVLVQCVHGVDASVTSKFDAKRQILTSGVRFHFSGQFWHIQGDLYAIQRTIEQFKFFEYLLHGYSFPRISVES